jgi:hypothetical protein
MQESFTLDPGRQVLWKNASGEAQSLSMKASDGFEITFNLLPGASVRLVGGQGSLTVTVDKPDQSLVGA